MHVVQKVIAVGASMTGAGGHRTSHVLNFELIIHEIFAATRQTVHAVAVWKVLEKFKSLANLGRIYDTSDSL